MLIRLKKDVTWICSFLYFSMKGILIPFIDYDTKNYIILNPGGSEIFLSDSDTPTKGNADNES